VGHSVVVKRSKPPVSVLRVRNSKGTKKRGHTHSDATSALVSSQTCVALLLRAAPRHVSILGCAAPQAAPRSFCSAPHAPRRR
jgi:hypothetical protein